MRCSQISVSAISPVNQVSRSSAVSPRITGFSHRGDGAGAGADSFVGRGGIGGKLSVAAAQNVLTYEYLRSNVFVDGTAPKTYRRRAGNTDGSVEPRRQ